MMRAVPKLAAAIALTMGFTLAGCATVPGDVATSSAMQTHVSLTMADGMADALMFVPASGQARAAVIVYPDLTGLRPAYAAIGQDIAEQGYVALVINEFYRSVKLDGTAATAQPLLPFGETMQRAAPMRASASDEAVIADARAIVAFLDAQQQVAAGARIGVLGIDIGGAHAFLAARALPERIAAVATVQPLSIATTRDNSPHLFVDRSKAAYLVHIAAPDDAREPEDKRDLAAAFAGAGLSGSVAVIDASRGYAVPDDPAYDAVAAASSMAAVFALFGSAL